MKLILILFMLICVNSWLISTIIEINQDGTGDYLIIQDGINNSTDGDTILVYPGTYFENIEILNRSIVLASLEMTTNDSTYINSTIIDGNQNGSCIYAENFDNGIIQGFTLQHGSGSIFYNQLQGGGLFIIDSNISLISCNIIYNSSDIGGGCYIYNTLAFLSNNYITNNHSMRTGGISISVDAYVTFDNENLNNIYLNFSGKSNDIYLATDTDIILNKFTVENPDIEFIGRNDAEYTFSCQQHAIEQVPEDLYVSTDGSDDNSGLTPEEPLKTISYANILIKADSLDPRNIYVADGLYSNSQTGEHLPINLKSYVSIIGESEENTIIDGDEYYPIMAGWDGEREVGIKNFTFQNCKLANRHWAPLTMMFDIVDDIWQRFTVTLENLTIINTTPRTSDDGPVGIEFVDADSIFMKNITLKDNTCRTAVHIWSMNLSAENLIIENTQYNSEHCRGSGLIMIRHNDYFPDDRTNIISNLQMNNNISISDIVWPPDTFTVADDCEAIVINGTFTENIQYGMGGGIICVDDNGKLTLINSIVHNNEGHPVYINDDALEFTIDHCFLSNGYDDLFIVGNPQVNWLDGNIRGDPFFVIDGDYPFALSELSPCIDAGTLDLPEGIELPEYDLAGYPRIVGETVDMGAYEYQGTNTNEELIINNERINISVYPNPFQPNNRDHRTSIKFNLLESCTVNLDIYNIKGQKVKSLMDAYASRGDYTCRWDGKDENGKQVSSGQYICKLNVNDETKAVRKMVIIGK